MDTITTATPKQAPPANRLVIPTAAWFGTQRGVAQPVPLTQYDDTLPMLAVSLYLNGKPYTVPEGAAINVRMDKRDGHYIYNPAYGLSDDRKTVYVAATLQMTTSAGEFPAILELVVGGDVAGTSILPLAIRKNPVPEDAIESTDEWKTIQQIAAQVETAAEIVTENEAAIQEIHDNLPAIQGAAGNADAAAASAKLAQSWAVGGTDSREGEDSDNSKFYAEKAAEWVERARTLAVAYTIDVPTTGWASGSLEWAGAIYTRKRTITAADATANPTQVTMEYAGGDYDAYCQIALLDTQDGSVVLWAQADPTAACQIRVVEVRPGENAE